MNTEWTRTTTLLLTIALLGGCTTTSEVVRDGPPTPYRSLQPADGIYQRRVRIDKGHPPTIQVEERPVCEQLQGVTALRTTYEVQHTDTGTSTTVGGIVGGVGLLWTGYGISQIGGNDDVESGSFFLGMFGLLLGPAMMGTGGVLLGQAAFADSPEELVSRYEGGDSKVKDDVEVRDAQALILEEPTPIADSLRECKDVAYRPATTLASKPVTLRLWVRDGEERIEDEAVLDEKGRATLGADAWKAASQWAAECHASLRVEAVLESDAVRAAELIPLSAKTIPPTTSLRSLPKKYRQPIQACIAAAPDRCVLGRSSGDCYAARRHKRSRRTTKLMNETLHDIFFTSCVTGNYGQCDWLASNTDDAQRAAHYRTIANYWRELAQLESADQRHKEEYSREYRQRSEERREQRKRNSNLERKTRQW